MVEQEIGLTAWLKPFVEKLGHKKRRQMCPVYVSGLIGPADRKSIEPMAERLALDHYDRLHHFISDGIWDAAPLEVELAVQADKIVGALDAFLVIDEHRPSEEGRPFRWGRAAICIDARQESQLPDAGIVDVGT